MKDKLVFVHLTKTEYVFAEVQDFFFCILLYIYHLFNKNEFNFKWDFHVRSEFNHYFFSKMIFIPWVSSEFHTFRNFQFKRSFMIYFLFAWYFNKTFKKSQQDICFFSWESLWSLSLVVLLAFVYSGPKSTEVLNINKEVGKSLNEITK